MKRFPSLFQPGMIGSLQLKNRLIMPAMGTQLADAEGKATDRLVSYYRTRAAGGVALVTPQFAAVSRDSVLPYTMALCDDAHVSDWSRVADAVHEAGAAFCIQLMHIGMLLLYSEVVPENFSILVPSMMPWLKETRNPYHELSPNDIERYVEDFGQAARRARQAGADAIEVHACHGCLVSSFMSPATNRRTDEYGGSVENRTRFARMVVERIRQEVGQRVPPVGQNQRQ